MTIIKQLKLSHTHVHLHSDLNHHISLITSLHSTVHCTFTPSPFSNPKFQNTPKLQIIIIILTKSKNVPTFYIHNRGTHNNNNLLQAFLCSATESERREAETKPNHVFSTLEFHCIVCSNPTPSAWHCAPFTLSP